jgi:hypothetical protein
MYTGQKHIGKRKDSIKIDTTISANRIKYHKLVKNLDYIKAVTKDYIKTFIEAYTLRLKLDKVEKLKFDIEESIKKKNGSELNTKGIFNELEKILKE